MGIRYCCLHKMRRFKNIYHFVSIVFSSKEKLKLILLKILIVFVFIAGAFGILYLINPELTVSLLKFKKLGVEIATNKAEELGNRGIGDGVGSSETITTSFGSRDIAALTLWPKVKNNPLSLFAGDMISVANVGSPIGGEYYLSVSYKITNLTNGSSTTVEDPRFMTLDADGSGSRIIDLNMPTGMYLFTAIKTNQMSAWIPINLSVKINAVSAVLVSPTIKLIPLSGALLADLKAGDQYGVKIQDMVYGLVKNQTVDIVYIGPDGQPVIVEQWARFDSKGVAIMTADPNMPLGTSKILSVRIHKRGDETLAPVCK